MVQILRLIVLLVQSLKIVKSMKAPNNEYYLFHKQRTISKNEPPDSVPCLHGLLVLRIGDRLLHECLHRRLFNRHRVDLQNGPETLWRNGILDSRSENETGDFG